jgi:hypothetical protein
MERFSEELLSGLSPRVELLGLHYDARRDVSRAFRHAILDSRVARVANVANIDSHRVRARHSRAARSTLRTSLAVRPAAPAGRSILLAIGLSSWRRCKSGRGVDWKGRRYHYHEDRGSRIEDRG